MSYNGSGTFQINTSGQPVVTGTVISSSAFNALTADLATGLSTAITKDGQTATTVRIPFAQGINSTLATDSTSTSTGSIITAGGVGIAKALYVGTTATFATTLGVGNATPAASGAGITFPATQSASSDANTLDDYEEGIWTPSVTFGSGSATVNAGAAYIKIGKTCFINGFIYFSSVSSAADATVTNLPFTAVSLTGSPRQVIVCREDAATGKMGQFFILPATTTGKLQDYLGANGATVISNGYSWLFSGTYNTSA